MDIKDLLTLGVAVYGAALSTFLLVRQILGERRRVTLVVDLPVADKDGKLTITNTGHRPVTITSVTMAVKARLRNKSLVYWRKLLREEPDVPFLLSDGQSKIIPIERVMLEAMDHDGANLMLIVRDSESHYYQRYEKVGGWLRFEGQGVSTDFDFRDTDKV